jgi:glycerol-3-phosphate dehydrogenase subunit C
VPELRVIELNIDCCGIAGTYGLKKEKYDISMAVGEQLFREIRDAKAEVAACDSETCRWQIEHGTGVHAVHPIELLYRGYGLDSHSPAPRERVVERVAKERP